MLRQYKVFFGSAAGIMLMLVAFISINVIAQRLSLRVDVTQEKVFSLSDGTERILAKLDRPTTARLYFSRSLKDIPPYVKAYATRVEEVLREYQRKSQGKLTVEVVDPKPDTDDEEWAQKYGIAANPLPRGDMLYFGVLMVSGAKEVVIPYLDPRREEFLEYDLSGAIVSLGEKSKVKVGLMTSLPMQGLRGFPQRDGDEPWALVRELGRNFALEQIPISAKEIPADIKTLLVIHPKNLAEDTLYAIDQFVMGGGRLMVAVDPMSRIDLQTSSPMDMTSGQLPQVSSDLGKLFSAWEIQYDPKKMVGDAALATQINAGGMIMTYPFIMSLTEPEFSKSSVVTNKLHQVLLGEAGILEVKPGGKTTMEPLLSTTADAGSVNGENAFLNSPDSLARDLKKSGKEQVVAAIFRGTFRSAFAARPDSDTKESTKPEKDPKKAHKSEATSEGQIIVIADTDFLSDESSVDKFRFGNQIMIRPRNDNLNVVFNGVDYLSGSDDLVAIRSKGRTARPFTKVLALQKNAQFKWQAEEERLTAELTQLEQKLSALQSKRTDQNRFALTSAQQDEIAKFREEERRIRIKRREVRKNLREDIEALGRTLVAINMLGMPAVASMFGTWVFIHRSRRRKTGGQP